MYVFVRSCVGNVRVHCALCCTHIYIYMCIHSMWNISNTLLIVQHCTTFAHCTFTQSTRFSWAWKYAFYIQCMDMQWHGHLYNFIVVTWYIYILAVRYGLQIRWSQQSDRERLVWHANDCCCIKFGHFNCSDARGRIWRAWFTALIWLVWHKKGRTKKKCVCRTSFAEFYMLDNVCACLTEPPTMIS